MTRLIVIQHIDREEPGLFYKIALERNIKVLICRRYLGEKIPELCAEDILLLLGGPMGIEDINSEKYSWLKEEVNLLKFALKNNIKIIGVCLGAQLLAFAAGGFVEPLKSKTLNKEKPEIGWSPISFVDSSLEFSSLNNYQLDVLHWHKDRILMPHTAKLIASSKECKEQLFCINSFAYGIQFHAEVEEGMISRWISEDNEFIVKALGLNAAKIIMKQQKEYEFKSLESRILFINIIYDLLHVKGNT